jgi:hypothetical protein
MADVHAGLGPFLGVFRQARRCSPAGIGVVMTIAGIAGIAVTTPLGALVDRTSARRSARGSATSWRNVSAIRRCSSRSAPSPP